MLIFPTNKAFEHNEQIGIIGLVKQVPSKKPQSQSVSACRKFRK